jgi:hypothetical protein
VVSIARYTIVAHLLLPWILWGLALWHHQAPVALFMFLHVAFPVLLVATYRHWKGQGVDVILLIIINHVATLVSGALAGWVASAL